MSNSINKKLLVLLLLIFVGQVVAAPLLSCSYSSSNDSTMSMQMDMSKHKMPMADLGIHKNMKCCDDCQCPDGMCLTVVMFSVNSLTITIIPTVFPDFLKLHFIPEYNPNSVFHPPILS